MSARIRLKRFGTKKRPYYRIVVMEKTQARDGRTIDEIGLYHPIEAEGKQIMFDVEKVRHWLRQGATPSDTVHRLFNKHGLKVEYGAAAASTLAAAAAETEARTVG
jgi:small subunit ribosomal protein S16